MRRFKFIFISLSALFVIGTISSVILYYVLSRDLPELFSVDDYEPLLVSEVFARSGEKIGEFYKNNENRKLVAIDEIPDLLKNAFLAAEDDDFYNHNGFNFQGIIRAVFKNVVAGKKVQGASTITQQTARTLFLSSHKTYTRKLKEAILARRMERHLSKDEILYLYLNQVYFGQGAHGVASAAETFFRKKVGELSLAEMAMMAGVLTAPSAYNPVSNPDRSKIRQLYVLKRMLETDRIDQDQYDVAADETITVYRRKKYKEVAPYFVETIRQLLVKELGEDQVLGKGLKIYSSLNFKAQKEAQASVRKGLRELDKRQGYRGPKGTLEISEQSLAAVATAGNSAKQPEGESESEEETPEDPLIAFLTKVRNRKIDKNVATFQLLPDGTTDQKKDFEPYQKKNDKGVTVSNIPPYLKKNEIVEGVVTEIDTKRNLVFVRFAEARGIIPLENMAWARPFNVTKLYGEHLHIKSVDKALKVGDIIDVKIVAKTAKGIDLDGGKKKKKKKKKPDLPFDLANYAELSLEQEPKAEAALLSFDLKTDDIVAMVGGSDFSKTKLNRTYQAKRQTGSSFKPIVYAAGLDRGLTPATPIMGAPIVYDQDTTEKEEGEEEAEQEKKKQMAENEEGEPEGVKVWKPGNYGGRFTGDILLRNALKRSLNTPTIRVLEKTGVSFVAQYAKRLGIFSPINMDMSMALGSSGISLYEMTKAFSIFGRQGKAIKPIIIHEVQSHDGEKLFESVSFDIRFQESLTTLGDEFNEKRQKYEEKMLSTTDQETQKVSPFFFNDPDQLISSQTAYLITTMLQAAVNEPGGTAGRVRTLGRDVAAKTGTTNGSYDAWFMGYTPQISTGVWVGFDQEQTLGKGETGGKAALPIWLTYMAEALKDLPKESFPIPNDIVFANIDNDTGRLASAKSHEVVRQAFRAGNEPGNVKTTEEDIERVQQQEEEEEKTEYLIEDY